MRIVVDAAGRPWAIAATIGTCQRLRFVGVDVFDPGGVDLAGLVADVPRWTVALYCIVQPEAAARCIGPDDFADKADGDFLERTAAAFASELAEFGWLAPKTDGDAPATSLEAWQAVYELAGVLGIDPSGLTAGELSRMAHGRRMHDWDIAASGQCLLANIHRDPKARSRPFETHELHPLRKRQKPAAARKLTKEEVAARWKAMHAAFGGKQRGRK